MLKIRIWKITGAFAVVLALMVTFGAGINIMTDSRDSQGGQAEASPALQGGGDGGDGGGGGGDGGGEPPPEQLPDLTVEIRDVTENCASAEECTLMVDLLVRNFGAGDAGPTDVFVLAPTLEHSPNVLLQVNGLGGVVGGEGEEHSFDDIALFPPGPSCYQPNCFVVAKVDVAQVVAERDETNNVFQVSDSSP